MISHIDIPDELGKQLIQTAGISQLDIDDGQFSLAAVEFDALTLAETRCGIVGNRPFDLSIMNLFNSMGVDFVVVVLDSQLRICSMAAQLNEESANRLSDMVEENGGSLRPNKGPDGWYLFESE